MPSRNVLYYGSEDPAPEKWDLRAGPLSLSFEDGGLRSIRFGRREILNRIYFAVRDERWGTVPGVVSNLSVKGGTDCFSIEYDADYRQGGIHFRTTAGIEGDGTGAITFSVRGEAVTAFRRNRIGFCVLHPVSKCAGKPCSVEDVDGRLLQARFPKLISPHQPFLGMRAISHDVAPGLAAEVRFSGDVFEMEDQRNWTDSSFKTYSTPLALPFPVDVPAGAVVRQAVRLSLRGRIVRPRPAIRRAPVHVTIGRRSTPMPAIGLAAAARETALTASEIDRLAALRPAHLRIDLDLAGGDVEARLTRAVAEATAMGAQLEVALHLSGAADAELGRLAELCRWVRPRVRRWLVFESDYGNRLGAARHALAGVDGLAKFVSGTTANFAELNRRRPDTSAIDGACFPINPQVHAFDNQSLVENLAAQHAVIESSRKFLHGLPISVSPVALKPEPDCRQVSLFGAGWTLGSLKYLSEARAASVTYYETTGRRGVMTAETVYPLYHVLADVGEFAGGQVVHSRSSEPLLLQSLALRIRNRTRLLLANLSAEQQRVRVTADAYGRVRIRELDERNAETAMRSPEAFRSGPDRLIHAKDRPLEFSMAPFAVTRLDSFYA